MSKVLKAFMKANFDFSSMKKAGVFPKEMKHTDYEGQAKIICHILGLESIYEYGKYEIRCHISYASGPAGLDDGRPMWVNKKGEIKTIPFVEIINENPMHITGDGGKK